MGVRRGESEQRQHAPGLEEVRAVEALPEGLGQERTNPKGAGAQVPRSGGARADSPTTGQRDGLVKFLVPDPRPHPGRQGQEGLPRGPEGQGDHYIDHEHTEQDVETGQGDRGGLQGAHGAGRDPGRGGGDCQARGATGVTEGSTWSQSRAVRAGTEAGVDDNTEHDTHHDMHYEHHDFDDDFWSCPSAQENEGHQVFMTKAAVKQFAKDGLDFSHENHAGEQAAKEAFEKRQFTSDKVEHILDLYNLDGTRGKRQGIHHGQGQRATFGYYAYGNFRGVSRRTSQWPHLVRYVNAHLAQKWTDDNGEVRSPTWTSISVSRNLPSAIHADKNNLRGSKNYIMTFGEHTGGQIFVEQPGGGIWRNNSKDIPVEGVLLDPQQGLCEFDPLRQHGTEAWQGKRWALTAYTARSYPEANNEEKRVLRDLGFGVPGRAEIRQMRETCGGQPRRQEPSSGPSRSSRPGQSTRRNLWKAAAALSIMFTTALSIMTEFAHEALPVAKAPEVALLEIGGVTATCRLAEYGGERLKLAEPILLEDLINDSDPVEGDFGLVETAVTRHQPGELWLHVRPEWTDEGIYEDVMEAVDFQLRGGRAVVFQNDDCDGGLWESTIEGWEETGYVVDHDFEIDGAEYVRVIYEADREYTKAKEVLANEDGPPERLRTEAEDRRPPDRADGAERLERSAAPLERGARAIRFPPSVPGHIASSLRRLHQNLGHPGVSDFVRHLRLAGASRAVLKAAKVLDCQVCARGKAPAIAKPAKIGSCYDSMRSLAWT